jgi:hypothetical protein
MENPCNGNERIVLEDAPLSVAETASASAPVSTATIPAPSLAPSSATPPSAATAPAPPVSDPKPPEHWGTFIRTAKPQEVKERLAGEIADILKRHSLDGSCCLALIEPSESIDSYDLDQIFNALNNLF